MSKNNGGPAFPFTPTQDRHNVTPGMTLRDYFAAKVAAGFVVDISQIKVCTGQSYATEIATMAYQLADAMLAERNK